MALLFMDSFDHYASADVLQKWTSVLNPTIGAVGQNSTNGCTLDAFSHVTKTLSPSGTTCIVGFAIKPNTFQASIATLRIMDGATDQVSITINSVGQVLAHRGNQSTLLGTSSTSLSSGIYQYMEVKVVIHDSTGTVTVRVNSDTILSLTSQDTNNGASAWTTIRLASSAVTSNYDDLYICDGSGATNNDFLGPIRVKAVFPDGAGNYSQFTPSAGSNYQNVDETLQDGDGTYNSETTAGEKDTYTFGALGLTGVVKAVQTNLIVRSDAAGAETVRPVFRISSTDYTGTTVGVSTSYADKTQVYETSPATASAWTVSEIDGAEFGIELVS